MGAILPIDRRFCGVSALPAIFDTAFSREPYGALATLQCDHRIVRREEGPDWLVLRHADIREALRNPALCVTPPRDPVVAKITNPLQHVLAAAGQSQRLWLSQRDAPDHTRLRRIVQPVYGQPLAQRLLDLTTQTAETLAGNLTEQAAQSFDLVAEFTAPLAQRFIGTLFDVPPQMIDHLGEWSQHVLRSLELGQSADVYKRGLIALGQFQSFFKSRIAAGHAMGPVVNALVESSCDGLLTEEEVIAQSALLYVSGHTTTQDLIGSSVLRLLTEPGLKHRIRAQPADLAGVIRETARIEPPTQYVVRWTNSDTDLFGQSVPAGDRILMMIAAANRDPAVFDRPDEFDIDRPLHTSMALGHGAHACLGGHIAMRVAECAVRCLLERFPRLSVTAKAPDWKPTFMFRGLESLTLQPGDGPS